MWAFGTGTLKINYFNQIFQPQSSGAQSLVECFAGMI